MTFFVPFSEVVVVRREMVSLFEPLIFPGISSLTTRYDAVTSLIKNLSCGPTPTEITNVSVANMWQLVMCWGSVWGLNTTLLYFVGFNFLNHRKVLIHILLLLCGSQPSVPTLPCQRRGIVCSHSSELLHTEQEFTGFPTFREFPRCKTLSFFPPLSLTLSVWGAADPLLTHPAAPSPGLDPRDQTHSEKLPCVISIHDCYQPRQIQISED